MKAPRLKPPDHTRVHTNAEFNKYLEDSYAYEAQCRADAAWYRGASVVCGIVSICCFAVLVILKLVRCSP